MSKGSRRFKAVKAKRKVDHGRHIAKRMAKKKAAAKKPAPKKSLGALAVLTQPTRDPRKIVVGQRHRGEFGDLKALATSIEARGLLQPIVITPADKLIAGERRLRAWQLSTFKDRPIPVHVVDIDKIVLGEWAENTLRQPFTLTEINAIRREIEPLEKALAKARQAAHTKTPERGRVTEKIAKAVGKGRKTIEKIAAVVEAAEEDPQRFGKLQADMDRTGRVDGPFKRLQVIKQGDELRAAPPPLPMHGPYHAGVIDYPWPHEIDMSQEELDERGRSLRPYAAMAIEEGVKFMRQVGAILAEDAVVGFWVTNYPPHIFAAEKLLAAAGLRGAVTGTWGKDKMGRGQILRDKSELCIIAVRGKPVVNLTNETTLWTGEGWERRENSQKPDAFYAMFEKLFAAPRYFDLFSRGGRGDNWDCHGDQVGRFAPVIAEKATAELIAAAAAEMPVVGELAPGAIEQALERVERGEMVDADLLAKLTELKLVEGKKKPKLLQAGREAIDDYEGVIDHKALAAIAGGQAVAGKVLERLIFERLVDDRKGLALTKRGEDKLRSLASQAEDRAALAALPGDADGLLAAQAACFARLDAAMIAGDRAACVREIETLDTIPRKARDVHDRMVDAASGAERQALEDGPDLTEVLEDACHAPIGAVPLWGQRGMFRVVLDGTPYLVKFEGHEQWGSLGLFDVFAEDPARPFPDIDGQTASCGIHLDFDFSEEDKPPGVSVAAYVERELRVAIEAGGLTLKSRKGKAAEPKLPKCWYRLPVDWKESHEPLTMGGITINKEWKRGKIVVSEEPVEVHPLRAAWVDGVKVRVCRACGCTEAHACEGGCAWVSEHDDLCTACAPAIEAHVVSMTLDHSDASHSDEVATCKCGWSDRVTRKLGSHQELDGKVRDHWFMVVGAARIAQPEPDDGLTIPAALRRKRRAPAAEAAE